MIELKTICRYYETKDIQTRALHEIDLKINPGEFIIIIGPSGSGKSTLLHILGCLDSPTKGEYFLEGHPVQLLSKEEKAKIRNRKMGFIFQSFNLLPELTVFENVELPLLYNDIKKKERISKVHYLLELFGLKNRISHFPSMLSGGQQQRVAIARALVCNPLVLFADEPTGTLDSETGLEIIDYLKILNKEQKMTIVMVTHNIEYLKYGTRVIEIADGRIKEKNEDY